MYVGGPWLTSWSDRLCNLQCEKSCFRFIDSNGDGECSIVVGLKNQRLKVFKGTAMAHDIALSGTPVSICDFYVSQVTLVISFNFIFLFALLFFCFLLSFAF